MRVGAVVVLPRAWPAGDKTVHALLSGGRPPDRVVVVDQAPDSSSSDAVRALFPYFDVVGAAGEGWAVAVNVGAQRLLARGVDAVLLLTAECIPGLGALAALEARLEAASGVGVVGPLLVPAAAPLEVLSAGGLLESPSWDPVHLREPRLVEDWEGAGPAARRWLDGACLLVRAAALDDVGPFDEDYVHSFADVDHHLRMGARGWGVECVPAAVASCDPGPVGAEIWVGDRLRFLTRHAPRSVLAREVGRQAREAARDLGRGDGERAVGRARGAARFLSRRWRPIPGG